MNPHRHRRCALLAILLPLVALAGHSAGAAPETSNYDSESPPQVVTDPDHLLRAQDTLRIQVLGEDEINRQCDSIEVSADLKITVPLLGTVDVAGKSVKQLQQYVRSRFDRDYLVNPQVLVTMLKYADRWVNVMGSVMKQGPVDVPDLRELTIVDAIALAGGQTRLADLQHVKLTHRTADGEREISVINVDAMMKKDGEKPLVLHAGDVIFVPERIL